MAIGLAIIRKILITIRENLRWISRTSRKTFSQNRKSGAIHKSNLLNPYTHLKDQILSAKKQDQLMNKSYQTEANFCQAIRPSWMRANFRAIVHFTYKHLAIQKTLNLRSCWV